MRRSRVIASWLTTFLLTAAVSFGIVSVGHDLHHSTTTGATSSVVGSTSQVAQLTTSGSSDVTTNFQGAESSVRQASNGGDN